MEINQFVTRTMSCLPSEVAKVAMIGGGALRAQFDATELKDIDLFFRSEVDYTAAENAMFRSDEFTYQGNAGRTTMFRHLRTGLEFNLIGFAFGTPWETTERFDFRCCRMVAWIEAGDVRMACDPHAVDDATHKRLVVLLSNGVERTMRRVEHYTHDYGYVMHGLTLVTDADIRRHVGSLPQGNGGY